jgi:hypothetical protein
VYQSSFKKGKRTFSGLKWFNKDFIHRPRLMLKSTKSFSLDFSPLSLKVEYFGLLGVSSFGRVRKWEIPSSSVDTLYGSN